MTTGKERMEAAFRGEKSDRVPVYLIPGAHYAEKAGYTLEEFFTQPKAALEVTRLSAGELESDVLFVPLNPYVTEAQDVFKKLMGKPMGAKRADIKEKLPKWKVRGAREDMLFSHHLDMCEKARGEFPDHYLTTAIGGPWTLATELRGPSEALMDLYDDKQFLFDLMEYATETVIVRSLAVVEAGIGLFLADPSAGMSLISPAVYMEHVHPYHQRLVKAIHEKGGKVVFHICGHVDPIFEQLVGLGVDGLSIDAPSSLAKLFEAGRGKTVIIGNVDPVMFIKGPRSALEEAAQRCLDIAKGDARYAIGPGCQLPLQADIENIKAFISYCHQHGTS